MKVYYLGFFGGDYWIVFSEWVEYGVVCVLVLRIVVVVLGGEINFKMIFVLLFEFLWIFCFKEKFVDVGYCFYKFFI